MASDLPSPYAHTRGGNQSPSQTLKHTAAVYLSAAGERVLGPKCACHMLHVAKSVQAHVT